MGQAFCAGFPSPADDFQEQGFELPRWLVPKPPATFLWRIAGFGISMRHAGIHDGDLACADRSLTPGHGRIVAAAVGEMSIKRMVIEGNQARPAFHTAERPAYALQELAEAEVWGVVRFTIRGHPIHGQEIALKGLATGQRAQHGCARASIRKSGLLTLFQPVDRP